MQRIRMRKVEVTRKHVRSTTWTVDEKRLDGCVDHTEKKIREGPVRVKSASK